MNPWLEPSRIRPIWWAAILIAVIATMFVLSFALFSGTFVRYIPVTLKSDRSGLVMQSGAKVKMRGIEVGQVAGVIAGAPVALKLDIYPDQVEYIPANVKAEIKASTAFGAKYVELTSPEDPSAQRISAGDVVWSSNVSTEVNTVFENLVGLLDQIEPAKLNAVLSALSEGLRGQGPAIGAATTDANQVLIAFNERSEAIRQDWRSFKDFSDTYAAAASDIVATLDAASTTSVTVVNRASDLDALLLNVIGLANSGLSLLAPNHGNLISAINDLEPTTRLLHLYSPELTCTITGAKIAYDGLKWAEGSNGKSVILDAALLLGYDPYRYPENLPRIAAKGGQGGVPGGCGSLPDVSKNFPARQLVVDTGWSGGPGEIRTNLGLGHPCFINYFPTTRAVPELPSTRCAGPPSPDNPWPPPGPLPFDPAVVAASPLPPPATPVAPSDTRGR